MAGKSIATLHSFFIFSARLGQKEGEEAEKILFYHPETTDLDTKIKSVGLCEAVIKFTSTFKPDRNCQTISTQKKRQSFLQAEPDFWIILTATIPHQQKTKDGHTYTEYYSEEVQDHVLQTVLQNSYKMFRLFMGTFESILDKSQNDFDHLRKRLAHFFKKYIQSLRIHQLDLLDVFNGMQFLPLERHAFLKIKCFLNLIEASFTQVKYTCFLYNDQLVWSGLEQEDMQILYKYLTTNLIPTYLEPVMINSRSSSPSKPLSVPNASGLYTKFMTGPASWSDIKSLQRIPKIYIHKYGKEQEACFLVVYRALSATICLLVDINFQMTVDFFKQLDSTMSQPLTILATDVGEQYNKATALALTESYPRYLYMYFNHMNLAQKSTVHPDAKKTGCISITSENMKLLADFNLDLSQLDDSGEIIGKTLNDCWVVGRLSDKREFYVVLPQKNASIVEVSDELKKLNASQFQNLFILE